MHLFLTRSQQASPVLLSTQEEVTSFLQEVPQPELTDHKPHRVLGLFQSQTQASKTLKYTLCTFTPVNSQLMLMCLKPNAVSLSTY